MGWGKFIKDAGKAAYNIGVFAYKHPEAIQVVAAATGHEGIAAGLGTVIAAKKATDAAKGLPVPVQPVPPVEVTRHDDLPAPPVVESPAPVVVPEVDLIGKWKGTLDRMAHEVLGYDMATDELYSNAKLLEAGDVAGVMKNLNDKKPK